MWEVESVFLHVLVLCCFVKVLFFLNFQSEVSTEYNFCANTLKSPLFMIMFSVINAKEINN